MTPYRVSATAPINAPTEHVYAIIADYRDSHARIVPKPEFRELVVEQGGCGAGTIVRAKVTLFGISKTVRVAISEPEPGRVLAESNLDGSFVTTFTVDPSPDSKGSLVTMTSDLKSRWGFLERFVMRRVLVSMLQRELKNLAELAESSVKLAG